MASNFYSSWDECPTKLWTLPTFSELAIMSCFQTHWFLHLLLHQRRHVTVPEPFSYLARRFLHARDRQHLHSLHKRGIRPVSGHSPRGWTSDLFSSQPRPELGGSLGRAVYAPGDGQTNPGYSSQSVQCLYVDHLLSVNKLVLCCACYHSGTYSSQSVQID